MHYTKPNSSWGDKPNLTNQMFVCLLAVLFILVTSWVLVKLKKFSKRLRKESVKARSWINLGLITLEL